MLRDVYICTYRYINGYVIPIALYRILVNYVMKNEVKMLMYGNSWIQGAKEMPHYLLVAYICDLNYIYLYASC